MLLTLEEILIQYPEQWVLIGNPELKTSNANGSLINRLLKGFVLLASKDKRELAFRAKDFVGNYEETACLYTGEVPKNRIFLL
jgi:hypothetical protein